MGSRRDSANRQSTANDRSGCHICYCWIPCCCDCCCGSGERQQPSRPVSNPSSSRTSTRVPVQASQTRSSQTNPSRQQRRSPRQPIHQSDVTAGTSSANLSRPPSYFPQETFAPSAQSGDDDVISPVTPSPAKYSYTSRVSRDPASFSQHAYRAGLTENKPLPPLPLVREVSSSSIALQESAPDHDLRTQISTATSPETGSFPRSSREPQRGTPQDLDPTQIALAMSLETEPFPNRRTSRWSPTERELARFASAIPPAHLVQPDSAVSGEDIELQTLSPQRGRLKRRGAGNRRPSDPNPKPTRTLGRLKEASRDQDADIMSGRRAGYPTELMSEGRGTQPSQSSYQSQPRAGPSESQNQPSQPGPSVARKRQGRGSRS